MKKNKNSEELKSYLFAHKLFPVINKNYPHRNLELEFELMIEHHQSGSCKCHKGGGLPKNIVAAWKNWIPYTKPDPELESKHKTELARQTELEFQQKYGTDSKSTNEEGLRKLREAKEKYLGKKYD